MQISLRSQMIAGTAAVVGASAVALTPVAPAMNLPALHAQSFAQVALTGFDNPLSELLNTTVMATNYLFNNAVPTKAKNWPFANFGTTLGGLPVLPAALTSAALGGYSSVGLIPQIIDDALPILSQLGYNATSYLQAATTGLYGAAYSLSEGVWNLPAGVITAVGQFLTDPAAAIQTLVDAVVGPVIEAASSLLISGGYIVTGMVNRTMALLSSVPSILTGLVATAVGIPTVLINKTIAIATDIVSNVLKFDIQGAWNATVDGLLGPAGLPGTLINLTIGAGVQTGPITSATPENIAANFVPSIRTATQTLVKTVAGDLATPVSTPAAAVSPAAARAAAVEAAPAAEATAGISAASAATAGNAAVEATVPAATVAAENVATDSAAPAADNPAPAKGKAGAHKATRSAQ